MLNLFLIIILIIGIAYLLCVFVQNYTVRKAKNVYESKQKLNDIPLQDEFELAKELSLTGESKQKYNDLLLEYKNYQEVLVPSIDKGIDVVKNDGKGINFIRTRRDWQATNGIINEADFSIKDIQAGLAQLHELDKQHHLVIDDLKEKHLNLKNEVSNNEETLGEISIGLKNELALTEKKLNEFIDLTHDGDQNKAEKILVNLNEDLEKIETFVNKAPSLANELNTVFPEQLGEIKSAYAKSKTQGINFNTDFSNVIQEIDKSILESTSKLNKLDLAGSENENNAIAQKIDELYFEVENEYDSKKKVKQNSNSIEKYLDFIKTQNVNLNKTVAKINANYVLDHSEIENNRQIAERLKNVDESINRYNKEINANQAIFSDIVMLQGNVINELEQIENIQTDLYDEVSTLPEQEQDANKALKYFDLEMRNKKRKLDNLNLPGLPKDYSEQFNTVIKEVTKLDKAINLPKINMDDISKQLTIIQSDMDILNENTYKLVDAAILSEQAIQYANRFASSSEVIATAQNQAKDYFYNKFDYSKSLSVISSALENEKRGTFQMIEKDYFDNKLNKVENVPEEKAD